MKRTISVFRCFMVLLCLFAGLQTVEARRASNVTISAKNQSLQSVLKEIER